MLSYYPFQRKTLKWWKKVFFHLLLLSVTNAFSFYKKIKSRSKSRPELSRFIRYVAMQLIEKGNIDNQPQPSTSSTVDRLCARHFPKCIPPTPKKQNPTRYCKVCSDKGKAETGKRVRKETRTFCEQCGVALCAKNCFEIFHTKANFTK